MLQISKVMLETEEVTLDDEAQKHLAQYFKHLYQNRNKFFGNARAVRKVVEKAIKNQHLRLAALTSAERTPEMLSQLTLDDVKEFEAGNDSLLEGGSQGRVGF